MPQTKKCIKCKKIKPVSSFYTRSGFTDQWESYCKKCHKKKSAKNQKNNPTPPKHERDLVDLLNSYGIPSHHGKDYKNKFLNVDIVCCGCVRIEIKKLQQIDDNKYMVRFTPKQMSRGLLAELVVLYHPVDDTYHIFGADETAFYHLDGSLKTGVSYSPDRPHRKPNALTKDVMDKAKNRFDLIKSAYQKWCVENNQSSL